MNEYRDIQASLLRFVKQFCLEQATYGFQLETLNLDASSNPTEWPEKDFIGLAEYQLDTDGQMTEVTVAFVVSTRTDPNLMRMAELTNRLMNRLVQPAKIGIVDEKTGASRGMLHVRGSTRAGVVQATESQPARPIMVRFRSDQALRQS